MLSQAHRRSIHSSLTPILGSEETDALLDELPASEADRPATKTDLAEVRVDLRVGFADHKSSMLEAQAQQLKWMITTIIGAMFAGMGLAAGLAALIAR